LFVEHGRSPAGRRAEAALWRDAKAGGAKEEWGRVRSSAPGGTRFIFVPPAMNRWAIFERPCGTSNHDTLNGYDTTKLLVDSFPTAAIVQLLNP